LHELKLIPGGFDANGNPWDKTKRPLFRKQYHVHEEEGKMSPGISSNEVVATSSIEMNKS
jgi:hypothetical protein